MHEFISEFVVANCKFVYILHHSTICSAAQFIRFIDNNSLRMRLSCATLWGCGRVATWVSHTYWPSMNFKKAWLVSGLELAPPFRLPTAIDLRFASACWARQGPERAVSSTESRTKYVKIYMITVWWNIKSDFMKTCLVQMHRHNALMPGYWVVFIVST